MNLTVHREKKKKKKTNYAIAECIFGAYTDSEGPDQTAHRRSLIWVFAVRLQNCCVHALQKLMTYSKVHHQIGLLIRIFTVLIYLEDTFFFTVHILLRLKTSKF